MPIKKQDTLQRGREFTFRLQGNCTESWITRYFKFPSLGNVYPNAQQTESSTVAQGNEIPEKFSKDD